jgi:hypothetical protein
MSLSATAGLVLPSGKDALVYPLGQGALSATPNLLG